MLADIVVDLQYGDCGKGKVTHHLAKTRDYTHVLRYNGGCNAGHTIFHNGKKFITHHIPCGVFFGIKSIIGSGCVVNPKQFLKEIEELEEGGISTAGLVFVARNAHVITQEHLNEENEEKKIGTTKRGNGPAYRDKYDRTGLRAEDCPELEPYLIDILEELHTAPHEPETYVLCEGAQGFGLDIDWGDYPYVTSSHCTVAGALLNGIPPWAVNEIWGVMKCYETYVGSKKFEADEPVFPLIRDIGGEFGATTGRPRQVGWTDLRLIKKAIMVNGVTDIVVNKMDVLEEVDTWRVISTEGEIKNLNSRVEFEAYLEKFIYDNFPDQGVEINFSSCLEGI